jgi:putative (di)nucleoside polyphosphate hydrolase
MKTSCGVIILNEHNEILMGHVTGQKFNDIPKGLLEEHEQPLACAMRECQEETALILVAQRMQEIGLQPYNKEKNLHLFLYCVNRDEIKLENLECQSFFEHFYSKKMVPEVDSFSWVALSEVEQMCAKSMGKLLTKLATNGLLDYNLNYRHEQLVDNLEQTRDNNNSHNRP